MKYHLLVFMILSALFSACNRSGYSKVERLRIESEDLNIIMSLSTIDDYKDSIKLRQESNQLTKRDINSKVTLLFKQRLLATVKDTLNPGVGIAAPQVGVNVKMIYVQRFDKSEEPFEVYFNPIIKEYGDSVKKGREGCLSVPGVMGQVDRPQKISIEYVDSTGKQISETVSGFTAVIFQHEIDHLYGKLYFDHISGGYSSLLPDE